MFVGNAIEKEQNEVSTHIQKMLSRQRISLQRLVFIHSGYANIIVQAWTVTRQVLSKTYMTVSMSSHIKLMERKWERNMISISDLQYSHQVKDVSLREVRRGTHTYRQLQWHPCLGPKTSCAHAPMALSFIPLHSCSHTSLQVDCTSIDQLLHS